ncbi:MAG: hypothetical protein AAGM40_11360 [Cyanobacteria bacterium J06573_2]
MITNKIFLVISIVSTITCLIIPTKAMAENNQPTEPTNQIKKSAENFVKQKALETIGIPGTARTPITTNSKETTTQETKNSVKLGGSLTQGISVTTPLITIPSMEINIGK